MASWDLSEVAPGEIIKADHVKEASNDWQGNVDANSHTLSNVGGLTGTFTLAAGRIPSLNASKIGSGTFAAARIPDIEGVSTSIASSRIPFSNGSNLSSDAQLAWGITNKVLLIGHHPGSPTADDAIDIGTRGTGNNVASKRIRFRSRDSGGTDENWTMDSDPDGNARFLMNTNNNLFSFGGTSVNVLQILPISGADVVRVREGQFAVTRDISTGFDAIKLTNQNEGSNTTKYVAVKFHGEDTVGAVKDVGSIRMVPTDTNWVSSNLDFFVRDSDTTARKMTLVGEGRLIIPALDGAIADGTLAASEISFYLNESGNTVTVKAKYSDGTTVKTGTIALT